jgi:hypothetical protein
MNDDVDSYSPNYRVPLALAARQESAEEPQ